MRYLFNWPVGWTTELSLAAWLWLVLWGAAFVLKDDEEIRIDSFADRRRATQAPAGGADRCRQHHRAVSRCRCPRRGRM
jgi:hypothetical protein